MKDGPRHEHSDDSRFLESITGFVAGEEGFIVDTQGWILANSLKLRDQRFLVN